MTEPAPPQTLTNSAVQAELYAAYDGWKNWVTPFICSAELAAYYAAELRGRTMTGANVLEIGFGNGEFLAWAKAAGATVAGCEITPAAIAAAQAHGINLFPADFERDSTLWHGQFDVIAAFDVFEHLDPPTIIAKLRAIAAMLRPGGWLVLRFPNGQSPFGLGPQHGDATHVTALSRAKMEQYAAGTGLTTLHYGGVARPATGTIVRRLVRAIRYVLRDMHMALLNFVYATDIELEPVVTMIFINPFTEDQGAASSSDHVQKSI